MKLQRSSFLRPRGRLRIWRGALTFAALAGWLRAGAAAPVAGNAFFEQKIRPIFVEHCYTCHSHDAEKIKGGLVLDSPAGVRNGGDSGPVIVPGDPERSLLINAVRYTDPDLQMPPKDEKLSAAQVADLEAWVKMGAPDPRPEQAVAPGQSDAARRHRAFQPLQQAPVPAVKNAAWAKTLVDRFVLAKLEANGLRPAPPADRRTLLRRATFDLTGLPPTAEEVAAFERDDSPEAFARVVDRLLASPRYGERWGRYWLDVARYADTKGYVYPAREEKKFVHAYAYRDWVVQALNADLPYDRFLKLQIAADQTPDAERDALAAMGFLTLGRRFFGVMHDIIDDRIDTLTRGTLGLTVSCARCHDHKFDPIPTRDYYSLYGVFAATTERTVVLDAGRQNAREYLDYEAELKRREDAFRRAFDERRAEQSKRLRARVTDYLKEVLQVKKLHTEEFYSFLVADEINPVIVRRWHAHLLETAKKFHPVWAPWHEFARIPAAEFPARAAGVIPGLTKPGQELNPLVVAAFTAKTPASMREVAEIYGRLLTDADQTPAPAADGKAAATTTPADALRQVLHAEDSPSVVPVGALVEMEWYFDEPTRVQLGKLSKAIDQWIVQSPGAPPHAVILTDRPAPANPHVFRRGNPANVGEEIPRRFLEILSGPERKPFANGSGRRELADAIAHRDNPLTARVMVNRVWQHHFGAGLVRTPSDFGTRSEPPSHPELLDWLAREFIEQGWSLKQLHRRLMLSAVYQQAGEAADPGARRPASEPVDPENRLLAHFNRQRLDFEALRDALLAVAGELDLRMGGPAAEMFAPPFTQRRTIYGYLDREFLPGLLRTFDFANPDLHSPQRSETTVPQQALFFLNSPFVAERAKALAARRELATLADPSEKIRALHRLAYQHEPDAAQLQRALHFIRQAEAPPVAEVESGPPPPPPAWSYGFGEFDENEKAVKSFQPLPHFTGEAWQGGAKWPDAKLGSLQLTASGGQAGKDRQHAVIRRWTSPVTGTVSVAGVIKHEHESADSIRAYLYSSRHGLLENSVLHHTTTEARVDALAVEPGDTIDFIVAIHEKPKSSDFTWAPVISLAGPKPAGAAAGQPAEWDAERDFGGPPPPRDPPLTAWEQYAQVLLSANEFLFVD